MILKRFRSTIIYLILFIIIIWFLVCYFRIYTIADSDREAIISAIVAIFVFGAGLLAQIVGDKIKQMQKDKQLKRIVIENLKTILDGLKLQNDNYKQIIDTLKSPSPENVMLSSYAELDYFETNQISSEDLNRVLIDFLKGDENIKIKTLGNLKKELRFIENSGDVIISGFEKLYTSIREYSDNVITGIVEIGAFFDKEATRLLHNEVNIEADRWFIDFSDLWGIAKSSLKISDDTFTNYEKLELEIIPKFFDFAKDNMEDPRTPMITAAFTKANSSIYQRKGTIKNLVKYVEFYLAKYEEAKTTVEKALELYNK